LVLAHRDEEISRAVRRHQLGVVDPAQEGDARSAAGDAGCE